MTIRLYQTLNIIDGKMNAFGTKEQLANFLEVDMPYITKMFNSHIGKSTLKCKNTQIYIVEIDSNVIGEQLEQLNAKYVNIVDERNKNRIQAAKNRADRIKKTVRHHIDMRIKHLDDERYNEFRDDDIIAINEAEHQHWHAAYYINALIDVYHNNKLHTTINLKKIFKLINMQWNMHTMYRVDKLFYNRMNNSTNVVNYQQFKNDLMKLNDGESLWLNEKTKLMWHYNLNDEYLKSNIIEYIEKLHNNIEDYNEVEVEVCS